MAIPVISENSGLFLLTKDVLMAPYRPYATNTPTSWAASGLPTGLSINGTTGVVSGIPTTLGNNTVALTATNGTGASAPLVFVMAVIGSALDDQGLIDINLDLATGLVTNPAMAADAPQTYGKNGNIPGYALGFVRDAVLRELDITGIIVTLRDGWEGSPVTLFSGAPATPLDPLSPRYRVTFDLSAQTILDALTEHEGDSVLGGTDNEARARVEIKVSWTATSIAGVTALNRTFVTFDVHLAKALATT